MKPIRALVVFGLAASIAGGAAQAAGKGPEIERQTWSFSGIFGQYDQAQLQRGFQVYKEVCASCHGLTKVAFRSLGQPGGPGLTEDQVKELAASYMIQDGPNDDGEMFEREGRPSDTFPPNFPNERAARAAHNGAYPLDLSLIAKARGIPHPEGVVAHVLTMASDIVTGYQEAGADYLYALMTGYVDPPEGFELQDGLNYNAAYPGHQIAMIQPIYDDAVQYTDGTPQTVSQHSKDVAAFLSWAADPHHDRRKQMGWIVMIYLLITTALLYVAKKRVWAGVKH
ncbi:MAG: cytochrome c1 [Hyphomicrobiaceae bacterium]